MTPGGISRRCRDFPARPAPLPTMAKSSSPIAARRRLPGWMPGRCKTKATFETGARPNGAAIVKRLSLGDRRLHRRRHEPTLQAFDLNGRRQAKYWICRAARAGASPMPRPSGCSSASATVDGLVGSLPDLSPIAQWQAASGGAHGLDIDHGRGRLYAACDDGALVESTAAPARSPTSGRSPARRM